jgi:hypothetical protein
MKKCYLCEANAQIQEKGYDLYVICSGECGPGPYLISRLEMNNVTGIRGKKIHARKQHVFDEVKRLRKKDRYRLILIHNNKVEFTHPNE